MRLLRAGDDHQARGISVEAVNDPRPSRLAPGHDAAFWAWVDRYPHAEKAKGYLLGWSAAARVETPPGEEID